MTHTVSNDALALIRQWEGVRLTAYPDPGSKDGNPITIGYGHTAGVKRGDKITQEQADAFLRADLAKVAASIDPLITVPVTDNQFGALVSFAFNVGTSAFAKSTLLKKLNQGKYEAVPGELARWNKNDGKVMAGLVNRRAAEAGLWAKGAFVTSSTVEAKASTPKLIDKETISWGAGIMATLGAAFGGTGPVQWALAAVLVIAFGVGLYLFIEKRVIAK